MVTGWLLATNCMTFGRYVEEGNSVCVMGMLNRSDDSLMIVHPPEVTSTGCLWTNMLLPVDVDGLILEGPRATALVTSPNSLPRQQQRT